MTDVSQTLPKILIVDDDREIRDLLSQFLHKHGYLVDTAADGATMHQQLAQTTYGLIVLDLMLPGDDGLTLCRQLRATSTMPIIMLTAVGEDMDRIIGLEMGADDYVTKPFNPRELLARIKAVLRRNEYAQASVQTQVLGQTQAFDPDQASGQAQAFGQAPSPLGTSGWDTQNTTPCFQFDGWRLDVGKRELRTHQPTEHPSKPGTLVSLTAGEFDLLLAFVEHPQRVLSRDQLLEYTKGYAAMSFDRSIDVQLSRLRRKIEANPKEPLLIKTVRGGGYIFTPSVQYTSSRVPSFPTYGRRSPEL